jgi:lipopolysaccharide export system protein LptC
MKRDKKGRATEYTLVKIEVGQFHPQPGLKKRQVISGTMHHFSGS